MESKWIVSRKRRRRMGKGFKHWSRRLGLIKNTAADKRRRIAPRRAGKGE